VSVHRGNGWTVLDTACCAGKPGAYDLGARLGVTTGTILLVVLRAAERWAPDLAQPDDAAIVPRKGRVLVEFADASTQLHHGDTQLLPSTRPPAAVINVGTNLAEVLVISAT
jgi:hypothetical protein